MNTYDFEIIYQKGSEIPADYLSRNVVDSIQIEDWQMEKAQDAKEWIADIKKWMLNGPQLLMQMQRDIWIIIGQTDFSWKTIFSKSESNTEENHQ